MHVDYVFIIYIICSCINIYIYMYTHGFGWADDATLLWYVLYTVGIYGKTL